MVRDLNEAYSAQSPVWSLSHLPRISIYIFINLDIKWLWYYIRFVKIILNDLTYYKLAWLLKYFDIIARRVRQKKNFKTDLPISVNSVGV